MVNARCYTIAECATEAAVAHGTDPAPQAAWVLLRNKCGSEKHAACMSTFLSFLSFKA